MKHKVLLGGVEDEDILAVAGGARAFVAVLFVAVGEGELEG